MSLGNTVSAPPVAAKLSPGTALLCHGLCCPQPSPPPPPLPPSPTPPLPPPPPPSTAQSVTVPLPVTQKHDAAQIELEHLDSHEGDGGRGEEQVHG